MEGERIRLQAKHVQVAEDEASNDDDAELPGVKTERTAEHVQVAEDELPGVKTAWTETDSSDLDMEQIAVLEAEAVAALEAEQAENEMMRERLAQHGPKQKARR